ncbi:hypothetical protein C8Q74DRAFT_894199 [Fomes fomentarius]|nr:hypothetical protein C8Q74DRAFT_894199 [Fomes fomentarius]
MCIRVSPNLVKHSITSTASTAALLSYFLPTTPPIFALMVECLKAPSLSLNDASGDNSSTFAADPPPNAAKHPAQGKIDLKSLSSTKTNHLTKQLLDIIQYARALEKWNNCIDHQHLCRASKPVRTWKCWECLNTSTSPRKRTWLSRLVTKLQEINDAPTCRRPSLSLGSCVDTLELERICEYIAPGGDDILVAAMERDVTCLVDASRRIRDCVESQAHGSAVYRFFTRNAAHYQLEFLKFEVVMAMVGMQLAVSFHRLRATAMLKAKVAEVLERSAALIAEHDALKTEIAALEAEIAALDHAVEESGQLDGSKAVPVTQACATAAIIALGESKE